jgi:chromodomain-helicase-DNA-binding protein 1
MDEAECKELMRPCKKQLKRLRDGTDDLERDQKVSVLKECLSAIGGHIDHLLETKFASLSSKEKDRWFHHLWAFSAYFWPKKVKPSKLRAIFNKLVMNGPTTTTAPGTAAAAAAAPPSRPAASGGAGSPAGGARVKTEPGAGGASENDGGHASGAATTTATSMDFKRKANPLQDAPIPKKPRTSMHSNGYGGSPAPAPGYAGSYYPPQQGAYGGSHPPPGPPPPPPPAHAFGGGGRESYPPPGYADRRDSPYREGRDREYRDGRYAYPPPPPAPSGGGGGGGYGGYQPYQPPPPPPPPSHGYDYRR